MSSPTTSSTTLSPSPMRLPRSPSSEPYEYPLHSTYCDEVKWMLRRPRSDASSDEDDDEPSMLQHDPSPTPLISSVLTKGDLAPPDYKLMPIRNPGGISMKYFSKSPFSFVRTALRDLTENHYEETPVEQLQPLVATRKSPQDPWLIPKTAPNSAKYTALISHMIKQNIVLPLSDLDLQNFMVAHDINAVTVLNLFAVVKDDEEKTARPIENGNPIKPAHFRADFSLPGASHFVETLLSTNTAGMTALHGDLANYYFQVPLVPARMLQHVFRIDNQLFCWKVLTMGYFKATRIAEALCLDLTLRGADDVPHETSQPNGLVRLKTGGFLVVIYDSFLLVDKPQVVDRFHQLIRNNCTNANAAVKYQTIAKLDDEFEYCGFLLKPGEHFLRWKIAPSTLRVWNLKLSVPLPSTLRSLWSLGGMLQFAFTVRLVDRRALAAFRQFQANRGAVSENAWDAHLRNKLAIALISKLTSMVTAINNDQFVLRNQGSIRRKNLLRGVFDATTARWSYALLSPTRVIYELNGAFESCTQIDQAEAIAGASCLERLFAQVKTDSTHVILLAGDNQSVLRAFRSGASSSSGIKREIDRCALVEFVEKFPRTPVILVDIPSEENYADIGTRPNISYSPAQVTQRLNDTISRINIAAKHYACTCSTYVDRKTSLRLMERVPSTDR